MLEDTLVTGATGGGIVAMLLALVAEFRTYLREQREDRKAVRAHELAERKHWRREERMLRAIATKLAAELPPDTVPISLDDVSDDDAA